MNLKKEIVATGTTKELKQEAMRMSDNSGALYADAKSNVLDGKRKT